MDLNEDTPYYFVLNVSDQTERTVYVDPNVAKQDLPNKTFKFRTVLGDVAGKAWSATGGTIGAGLGVLFSGGIGSLFDSGAENKVGKGLARSKTAIQASYENRKNNVQNQVDSFIAKGYSYFGFSEEDKTWLSELLVNEKIIHTRTKDEDKYSSREIFYL